MKMYMQVRSRIPSDIRNKYPSWKMDIEQVRWFFRLSPDQYEEPQAHSRGCVKAIYARAERASRRNISL